jgi:hypothetical protein
VKQSITMAAMVTGPGDGTVPDGFEADHVVGIDITILSRAFCNEPIPTQKSAVRHHP